MQEILSNLRQAQQKFMSLG